MSKENQIELHRTRERIIKLELSIEKKQNRLKEIDAKIANIDDQIATITAEIRKKEIHK